MLRILTFSLLVLFALGDLTWETDSGIDFKTVKRKELRKAFKAWKKEFDKTYKNKHDEMIHYGTFVQNWMKIVAWNDQSDVSYKLGHNQFSDLTPKEFRYYVHGHEGSCLRRDKMKLPHKKTLITEPSIAIDLPDEVDWTTKGVVTPVKNQKQCGSCWAFSTTGSIECRTAIATGKLVSLSEQQLVDCSKAEGNQGCQGGLMDDAFQYVKKVGGLCTEEAYRYTARNGICREKTCGEKYDPISSYTDVQKRSSEGLQEAAAAGCVSVAIEADQSAFQLYKSGVLDGRCGKKLDHGVLVVGYGTDAKSGEKYWKVKNSWGASWGEEGYVRICRECGKDFGNGECGILDSASFPVV